MTSQKTQKNSFKYNCEKCDFYCNNKNDYRRHLQTKKHNTSQYLHHDLQKTHYICDCGKAYKHRQSLNNHKKTCAYINQEENIIIEPSETPTNEILTNNNPDVSSLLLRLIETNEDLKEQIIELASKPRTVHNNQNNSKVSPVKQG